MRRSAAPLSVIVLVHFSSRVYTVEYLDRKQSEKEIVIWVQTSCTNVGQNLSKTDSDTGFKSGSQEIKLYHCHLETSVQESPSSKKIVSRNKMNRPSKLFKRVRNTFMSMPMILGDSIYCHSVSTRIFLQKKDGYKSIVANWG